MKEYESLKTMYPEHISLDQFRCICHIAKRSALYLIQHEIVPAINTGKQTWRYKIAMDDVITYLRQREQQGSMIPSGAVSSRSVHNKKHCVVTYSEVINPGEEDVLRQYFTCLLAKYPDVLKVQDIIKITGLCDKKAVHLIKDGVIQSIAKQGGYLVPKAFLLEFVVSKEFICFKSKSTVFKKVLDNFQFWYETRTSE